MKSKTLKDMKCSEVSCGDDGGDDFHHTYNTFEEQFREDKELMEEHNLRNYSDYYVNYDELKQEAIKHIKDKENAIRNGLLKPDEFETLSAERTREYCGQIKWIKWFFNIEEKDLK